MTAAKPTTRVLVVDDEAAFRELLTAFLATFDDVEVVGSASNGEQGVSRVEELRPDVVLMDLQMPGMDGIGATAAITERHPQVAVLALTVMADTSTIVAALRAGARGYLLKDTSPTRLVEHVRAVASGGGALSPEVARAVVAEMVATRSARGEGDALPPPSEGEMAVLARLAQGHGNAAIARDLYVSEGTVKARLLALSRKWSVSGRAQILMAATRAGYVS